MNIDELMANFGGWMQPWMWWAAGIAWAALVLLVGQMIERGVRRLFPDGQASWLGRIFRVLAYLASALIAVYFLLSGAGAAFLADPLMVIERKLVLVAVSVGVADLALLLVNLAIDRYLARTDPSVRSARVLTLLPLLRNIAMLSLGGLLALVVLGEFGVNIAPLLAGAGVVGVAVGFGSQKLVQDVITGAFMLFENTIAIGDVVKIADHTGTVEGMTVRTLRLRDDKGQVHTLPFSAVPNVINMSRDYGYYPFEINITYDSDVGRALAVLGEVMAEMQIDPQVASELLAPPEIFGVERLGEWSVVLAGRIKTLPCRQQIVARVLNKKIKDKFDVNGIKLADRSRLAAAINPA